MLMGGGVPMYKMRANKGLLWGALIVLAIGGLISAYFINEDAYSSESSRGLFTLIVTCVLSLFCVISATSHFWFRHLWHRRPGYKRG